uniref:Myosin-binding protein H n=1 Tax=Phallusia mammillata TaxID=59560 RepID=A0A6F9DLU0_9ASCI|nr:myosin-binding protein C, cardiac-type-like [Phallusia mammillata]
MSSVGKTDLSGKKVIKKKVVKKVVKKKKEEPAAEPAPAKTAAVEPKPEPVKQEEKPKEQPKEPKQQPEKVLEPQKATEETTDGAKPDENTAAGAETIVEKPENVSTTEAPIVEEHKIEIKKGYVPDEKDVQRDVDFRNRLKKVQKSISSGGFSERLKKEKQTSGKMDVWSLLKSASTRDYESIGFKFGIHDMRSMLRRLSQLSKTANKKCPSFAQKLPETMSMDLGEKIVLEAEVANEQMTVKWQKNGAEITPGKQYQIVTKANKRYLIIDQATKDDDATFTCVVGKDVTSCEVFVQEPPVTIAKGLEDVQVVAGSDAEFTCEMSSENGKFKILKDGIDLPSSDRFKVKKEGAKVTFNIAGVAPEDEGFYQFLTNGSSSCAEMLVQEPEAVIVRPFSDLKVNFKDTAEFFCEVSNEETKGNWLKDGKPLKGDDRVKITETGKARKLVINEVQDNDQGEYTFAAEDNPSCAITAALEMTGGHITVERKKVPPKIFLDHSMKDRSIVVKAGNKIKLDIPISGDPAPVPEWKKGPKEGKQLAVPATGKRMWVNTSAEHGLTSLVITEAKLEDSDDYYCDLVWDKAETEGADSEYIKRQEIQIKIQVLDVPSAPTVPKISDVTAETCYVAWTEPACNGGCPIKGYIIERKKIKSERWIRLNVEPLPFIEYVARRMIEGTEYQIRVRAANEVGIGEASKACIPFTPLVCFRLHARGAKNCFRQQSPPRQFARVFRCIDINPIWIVTPANIAPCSEPTGLKVSSATDDSLELSWLPPAEIGAAGLDGYKLEQQLVGAEPEEWKSAHVEALLPGQTTKIVLDKLVTGKKYRFRLSALNRAGTSGYAEIGPVVCAAVVEEAKIVLPRHLLKPVKVKVGAKLHVNVPYQGRPKPQLSWTKEGKALEEHVALRTSLDSSVLFIRKAERWDSGVYDLQLKVGDDIVTSKIEVAVIDIPSKPRQVKLGEVVGNSASLKWEEPSDNGNTDILGYVVEKRDARSDEWYVVYDKLRHKQCQVSDLVLGNNYYFRVKAFNEVGVGESNATKDGANIPKEKTVYKKPDYPAMDFRIKPEFTQVLNSRRIVENYNGTLSCALKCNPRPKVRWYKNKVEIIDNPKYKMTQAMGIVQLEIRRARAGDAGVYTVSAANELGEASCSAEVTVKEFKSQG